MNTYYQPYCDFPAHAKNYASLSFMFWMVKSYTANPNGLAPIIVFQAFTIESYLNSLGSDNLVIWDELERLPWRKKVIILHKTVNKEVDWGSRSLQFATEVFSIRDKLAHGKPERILGQFYNTYEEAKSVLGKTEMEPEWYRKITKEWVLDSVGRFHELMEYLGGLFSRPESNYKFTAEGGILTNHNKIA